MCFFFIFFLWAPPSYVIAIPVLILGATALPVPILRPATRFYFWRTIRRIVLSPVTTATFTDVFVADQLTSVTRFLVFSQMAVCLGGATATAGNTGSGSGTVAAGVSSCSLTASPVIYVLSILPSWFRLMQCARKYRDSGNGWDAANALKLSGRSLLASIGGIGIGY
jgi:hypothetical protein